MSKNYIKVLLKPFRESKVVEGLLKWFEPSASVNTGGVRGGKDEVNIIFVGLIDDVV